MSSLIGGAQNPADQIIFFPSYAPRLAGNVVCFYNIDFGTPGTVRWTDGIENSTESATPLTSGPIPTPLQSQVNSKFNDAYTSTTVNSFGNALIDLIIPESSAVDNVKGFQNVVNWDEPPVTNV